MIECGNHLNGVSVTGVDDGDDARVQAAEIVQPARSEEFLMRPEDRRHCRVVRPQVVTVNASCQTASSRRYMIKNVNARMADTPHRRGVRLLVQPETLIVHPAIKMYGQLRNPHDRFRTH